MKNLDEIELKDLDEKLNNDSYSPESKQKKSSILEPWFLFALGSMFGLGTSNFLNG